MKSGSVDVRLKEKEKGLIRTLVGGTIFGLGWALAGACPGPMFIMLGHGYWIFALLLLSATFGTFTYGVVKDKLPH